MTGMAHEAPRPARSSAVIAAWAVLVGMGGTSVTYNVYHATHNGSMNLGLALLYGIAPVFAAALLSHIVAEHDGGRFLQAVTFAVMLGAMTLSIGATAAVVEPAAGPWMQWLFGAVLDAAALVALRVILSSRKHKAAAAEAMEAAERTVAEAERIAAEAAGSVAEAERKSAALEAELATRSAELVAETAESVTTLEAELTAMRTELAAANATAEALREAASARLRKRSQPAGAPAGKSASQSDSTEDLTLELRAVQMLNAHPELKKPRMGSELGRRLGAAESTGRRLHSSLTGEQLPGEAGEANEEQPQNRSGESAQERSGEQS